MFLTCNLADQTVQNGEFYLFDLKTLRHTFFQEILRLKKLWTESSSQGKCII